MCCLSNIICLKKKLIIFQSKDEHLIFNLIKLFNKCLFFFNFHLLIEIVDAYPTIKENIILGNTKRKSFLMKFNFH